MRTVFISYNRDSRDAVEGLAADLVDESYEPWFDKELTGGQLWWDSILERIRGCDIFVYALTPESLESQACRRELKYALQLRKPLLPVRLSEQVKPEHLPPAISEVHCLDYRVENKDDFKALRKALKNLPCAPALPDPLPDPPPVPKSYIVTLKERIDTESPLDPKEQIVLVIELRDKYREGRSGAEILALLERLNRRDDTLAKVAREIDAVRAEILQGGAAKGVQPDADEARLEALERIRDLCAWRRQQLLDEARGKVIERVTSQQRLDMDDATDRLADPMERIETRSSLDAGSAHGAPGIAKAAHAPTPAGSAPQRNRRAGNEETDAPVHPKVAGSEPAPAAKGRAQGKATEPGGVETRGKPVETISKQLRLDEAPQECERVMRRVVGCGEVWIFEIDPQNCFKLSLDDSEPHCIVATATLRDTVGDPSSEQLKALGWEVREHSFAKGAAGAAAVYATGGLAALALLSKTVRDMLMSFEATYSWPVPRSGVLARPAAEFALALQRAAHGTESIRVRKEGEE